MIDHRLIRTGVPAPAAVLDPPSTRGLARAVRVALIVRTRFYRDSLASGLGLAASVEVVGAGGTWSEATSVFRDAQPEVVLLDTAVAIRTDTIRSIRAVAPCASVIALSVDDVPEQILPLAEAGVAGYVTAQQSLAELVEVIGSVVRGEMPCSPRVAASLLTHVATLAVSREPERDVPLTPRELQIVELIACGLSNREISVRLTIELSTVKNHVHNVLDKLEVRSREEAVARLRHCTSVSRRDATRRSAVRAAPVGL